MQETNQIVSKLTDSNQSVCVKSALLFV